MPRKCINAEPLTNAEKQVRFRNKQRRYMSMEQENRAIKKLYQELCDILAILKDEQLYAIAPILRYMKFMEKIYDRIKTEEIEEFLDKLDLSFYPCAFLNRDDDENAELEAEWEEDNDE